MFHSGLDARGHLQMEHLWLRLMHLEVLPFCFRVPSFVCTLYHSLNIACLSGLKQKGGKITPNRLRRAMENTASLPDHNDSGAPPTLTYGRGLLQVISLGSPHNH